MSYAGTNVIFDADSHLMELPDFLERHAEPGNPARLPRLRFATAAGSGIDRDLEEYIEMGDRQAPEHIERLLELGDELTRGPKGYQALGAFNRDDRRTAMDRLGFRRQLVFATFSTAVAFDQGVDVALRYAAARAHNRGMAEFCGADERLMGVGAVPLDEPEAALAELDFALDAGLEAIWIPHRDCGGRSPGHDDFDPFWARLAQARVPFVLHVGGDPLQLPEAWMNTGRPIPTDWGGGGENVRGKDMAALHHAAERFIAVLMLDGVLDRHPRLTGAVVELGAGWVPQMLERLDWVVEIWGRTDEALRHLSRKPSQMAREQLGFTPYVYEDVGRLMTHSDPSLYLFSSDYPHTEGGRNPIGRFDASLSAAAVAEPDRQRFYADNFQRIFPRVAS